MKLETKVIEVHSPYDGSLIAELNYDSKEEIFKQIDRMHSFFSNIENRKTKYQRIEILEKFLELFKSKKEEIIYSAIKEGGKPRTDSEIEFDRAVEGIKIAIYELQNFTGDIIPMDLNKKSEKHLAFTQPEPKGLVYAISAFNHPINLIIHQVIPAIAVGCPVIIKPATKTPCTCKMITELLLKSGLDENWVFYTLCDNESSTAIVENEKISFLSFIGSEKVGWYLRSKLSPGATCALEHGGVAPTIIDRNYPLENIVDKIIKSAFYHAGQVCVSLQRLYIHKDDFKKTVELLKDKVNKLKLGDPLENDTDIGPIISKSEYQRITEWIEEARNNSDEIYQNQSPAHEFNLYPPTLVIKPSQEIKVSKEELFGPALCIYEYQDIEEAFRQANSLPYCFQSSIFTQDLNLAHKASKKLNAMTVLINEQTAFRVDWMPFAGSQRSGLGYGGIKYTMQEMVDQKQTLFNFN